MNELTEADVLQRLVPELEADGYEVYVRPNRVLLPAFFGDYMPDAIAKRADKNLAIEVARQAPKAGRGLSALARLFEGQDKWQLRVIFVAPNTVQQTLEVQPVATIKKQIDEVRRLAGGKQNGPALLLAWAALEALARALSSTQFERPQTPGRIVQVLAQDGYITPTEEDRLRELADKRNRFIHGELQVRATKAELEAFARTLENLLKMVGKEPATAL